MIEAKYKDMNPTLETVVKTASGYNEYEYVFKVGKSF